jgi:phospholipid/cholesterol/gamma-HCH transport system substrate-binding protein
MKRMTYIKIGLVASFSLVALIWGLNFLKGKGTFNSDDLYYVVYERIDGLATTNPVLINGYKVGQVRDIHFMPDNSNRLVVEIAVKKEFRFHTTTIARIFSSDFLGTKAIELKTGKDNTWHASGDTLVPDFEGSLQELVSVQMLPLKNKAESLMKEMEDAIEIVKVIFNEQSRSDISASFTNIKATFDHLERSTSNLDSIVSGGKARFIAIIRNIESISENLKNNNKVLSMAISNMANITDSLAKADLKRVVDKTYSVMVQMDEITRKINNSEGTMGLLINNDTLFRNLEDATYNLNRLLEDLRLNPKRYVQFSAFNLGKTVYVDQGQTENPVTQGKIIYKILIKSSNIPIALTPDNFNGYKNVEEAMMGGTYIYLIGKKKNLENARSFLNEVKIDFPDAFIVQISEGSYVPVH